MPSVHLLQLLISSELATYPDKEINLVYRIESIESNPIKVCRVNLASPPAAFWLYSYVYKLQKD